MVRAFWRLKHQLASTDEITRLTWSCHQIKIERERESTESRVNERDAATSPRPYLARSSEIGYQVFNPLHGVLDFFFFHMAPTYIQTAYILLA